MRIATAVRQESEEVSEQFNGGRYKYTVTHLKSTPLGVGFKTTILNTSDSAVEFGIVDCEDNEVSGCKVCNPGEQVEFDVSDLQSLNCYIKFRPV